MTADGPAPQFDHSRRPRWHLEETILFLSTLKWSVLGGLAGLCVGAATRGFLWLLELFSSVAGQLDTSYFRSYLLLPVFLPICLWLVRTFAPDARGHGTEAVIAAVHKRSGKIDWKVAPIKLFATIITLAFGGSVGKEGPCAQIGAALTSFFSDVFRLSSSDRRRLVICGISAGFSAVFGTPVSGAIFGIEVLYLGRIEYGVLFPSLVAGITAHLVCNVAPPLPAFPAAHAAVSQPSMLGVSIFCGIAFGLVALGFIETHRAVRRYLSRYREYPYGVAAAGGVALALTYAVFGREYSALGTSTIDAAFAGENVPWLAFALKTLTTAVTLEVGGSGGIVTPLFFVGATSGAALSHIIDLPTGVLAAFGFVALLGSATNAPVAAAVMGMELLPGPIGVYATLCTCTAYIIVGHRSVYPSQRLQTAKSASLEFPEDATLGEIKSDAVHFHAGSLVRFFRTKWPRSK